MFNKPPVQTVERGAPSPDSREQELSTACLQDDTRCSRPAPLWNYISRKMLANWDVLRT